MKKKHWLKKNKKAKEEKVSTSPEMIDQNEGCRVEGCHNAAIEATSSHCPEHDALRLSQGNDKKSPAAEFKEEVALRSAQHEGEPMSLQVDCDDEKCIAAKSPEPLINFLLDLELSVDEVRQCPYYTSIRGGIWMVRTEKIPCTSNLTEKIAIGIKRNQSIFFSDLSQFNGDPSGKFGKDIIDKLSPSREEKGCSYTNLLFWCREVFFFNKVLDILFKLHVKNIKAARLQVGNNIVYLVQASGIRSPIALSKFNDTDDVRLFYPIFTPLETNKIWVEWGWQYKLLNHNFLQPDDSKTLFVFGKGERIFSKRPEFLRLLEFAELKFEAGTQTQPGEPRNFEEGKYDYTLQLKPGWKTWGKQELDDLRQQEREIQERIEWLEGIESIFENQVAHRVLFYPFGPDSRDPIFPQIFFRNHSFNQLRQFKFYYGDLGSLGEGALVGSQYFIDRQTERGAEIASKYYPRSGVVFETCRDWMIAANLRVMTPEGQDLFPYLQVNEEDTRIIVEAFLKTVVRFDSETNRDVRLDPQKIERIRHHPEEYLFFLFKKEGQFARNAGNHPIEGIVIHENYFSGFNIKLANLGIHFSKTNNERNYDNKVFRNTVVHNFANQFTVSTDTLKTHLENTFQNERKILKNKIEEFLEFVEKTEKTLTERSEKIDQTYKEITTKEAIIKAYEGFLENTIGGYISLLRGGSLNFISFLKKINLLINEVNKDIGVISSNNAEKYIKQIDHFKDINSESKSLNDGMKDLLRKRENSRNAMKELIGLNEALQLEFDKANWGSLETTDHLDVVWNINHALKGLSDQLSLVEKHLFNVDEKSNRRKIYSITPQQDRFINEWQNHIFSRLRQFRSHTVMKESKNGGENIEKILNDCQVPVQQCLQDIENAVKSLEEVKQRQSFKRESSRKISKYVLELRKHIKNLNSFF